MTWQYSFGHMTLANIQWSIQFVMRCACIDL